MSTNFGSYLQSTPRIFKVTLPQVSLSIRHLQKTHMLIEIDSLVLYLLGTQKTHMLNKTESSLVPYSARIEISQVK